MWKVVIKIVIKVWGSRKVNIDILKIQNVLRFILLIVNCMKYVLICDLFIFSIVIAWFWLKTKLI